MPAGTELYGVYVTKDELKTYMSDQKNSGFLPRDDRLISRFCVQASRRLDQWCNRSFAPRLMIKDYDYQFGGTGYNRTGGLGGNYGGSGGFRNLTPTRISRRSYNRSLQLKLDDDLLTLLTVTTNNGGTTIPTSALLLRRGPSLNVIPYDTLEIDGSTTHTWSFTGTPQSANQVTGYFGFHRFWPDQAWELIGTVNGAQLSTDTTITITQDPLTEVGQLFGPSFQEQFLIRFGDTLDATEELAYITKVTTDGSTYTFDCIRGVNGTSAIALPDATNIYAYRPMFDVMDALFELAAYTYRRRFAVGKRDDRAIMSRDGMVLLPSTIPDSVKSFVKKYKRQRPL